MLTADMLVPVICLILRCFRSRLTCICASESLSEMLWELAVDPDRGLFSCRNNSGPALKEWRMGPCSTSCWGLWGPGESGPRRVTVSPLFSPAFTSLANVVWLCCCLRFLYSIMSLVMVLSVAMVYSLFPALSHHSFLRPPSLLSPLSWGGLLPTHQGCGPPLRAARQGGGGSCPRRAFRGPTGPRETVWRSPN